MPWGKRWCSDELVIRIDLIFPEGEKREGVCKMVPRKKKVCERDFVFGLISFGALSMGGGEAVSSTFLKTALGVCDVYMFTSCPERMSI